MDERLFDDAFCVDKPLGYYIRKLSSSRLEHILTCAENIALVQFATYASPSTDLHYEAPVDGLSGSPSDTHSHPWSPHRFYPPEADKR